jgi:hypothetical protein
VVVITGPVIISELKLFQNVRFWNRPLKIGLFGNFSFCVLCRLKIVNSKMNRALKQAQLLSFEIWSTVGMVLL